MRAQTPEPVRAKTEFYQIDLRPAPFKNTASTVKCLKHVLGTVL